MNAHKDIFCCPKPCIGEWEHVPGKLMQCDATFDGLVGVNKDCAIFLLNTGIYSAAVIKFNEHCGI